jgi:RNA polymerase sigma factor (sigma-70 family)
LKTRDRVVFEYLYECYCAALNGVVKRIIPEQEIAEEVLHDAFIRIWERIDSYDSEKGRLFTWMLNLTRNLAIDRTRSGEISRARKTGKLEQLVHPEEARGTVVQNVDTIGLAEVLAKLPPEQRLVVEYLYLKGYTQSEMSDELDIPLGTVKTRMRMAMSALRAIMNVK